MTTKQLDRFEELLKSWNEHQELRQQGAPVADLFESRTKLDELRQEQLVTAA